MDTLDNPAPYLRMPNMTLAEAETMRLDTVGEMIERLRNSAWRKLGQPRIRPGVTLGPVPGGWLLSIDEHEGPLYEFDGNTLGGVYREAMEWARAVPRPTQDEEG